MFIDVFIALWTGYAIFNGTDGLKNWKDFFAATKYQGNPAYQISAFLLIGMCLGCIVAVGAGLKKLVFKK